MIRRQDTKNRLTLVPATESAVHSASAPSAEISAIIVSTSRMRGTLLSTTGSLVSRQAASTGSAPFLFPAARTVPWSGRPPSIAKACIPVASVVALMRRGIVDG